MRILFIEDEKLTAETIAEKLRYYYVIDIALTGKQGQDLATINDYDLFIIDYNLPDLDGVTICKKLRAEEFTAPILILTGNDAVHQKVTALDAGADDYLTKPFNFEELKARIRALLRRQFPDSDNRTVLTFADLVFDTKSNLITRAGQKIVLRRKERQLLEYLLRNHGQTLTRTMMMQHLWDGAADPVGNVIDVHMNHLRDKIDKGFPVKLIHTVYGYGYKIDEKE